MTNNDASKITRTQAEAMATTIRETATAAAALLATQAVEEAAAVVGRAVIDAAIVVGRAAVAAKVVSDAAEAAATEVVHRADVVRRSFNLGPMSRASRVLTWASLITISVGAVGLLTILWGLLYPYTGLTTLTIVSTQKAVAPGGLYTWKVSYCTDGHLPQPITIARDLSMGRPTDTDEPLAFPLPSLTYVIRQRCESFVRGVLVPTGIPPGPYHLHIHTAVTLNALRVVRQEFMGDTFEVK